MSAITDRLGIGDEIRELKLGRTLTSRDPSVAFHTIRYDFKPASVDREKAAVLDVESNNKVTVTAPNTEGSGASETIFKGSRKPHQKECVLIIDHKTGEITLEKLNQNITVKRTRQQNPKNGDRAPKQLSSGRPNTPIDTKKLVPQMTGSQQKPNSSPLNNRQNSPNNKLSPNKANSNGQSMSQLHRSSPSMSQPISPSMPTLSSLSSMTGNGKASVTSSNSTFVHNKRDKDNDRPKGKHKNELGLSDSSSDSSDHESSSSSSDDSSDSSDENPTEDNSARKPLNSGNTFNNSTINNNKSKVNQISDNSSSDSESDNEFETVPESSSSHNNGVNGSAPVLLSMPKFSDISEDLRLSESGSDSED